MIESAQQSIVDSVTTELNTTQSIYDSAIATGDITIDTNSLASDIASYTTDLSEGQDQLTSLDKIASTAVKKLDTAKTILTTNEVNYFTAAAAYAVAEQNIKIKKGVMYQMASQQRTFKSKQSHAQHTYEFYKTRKNDPKWRADYLSIRRILFIENTIGLIVFAVVIYFGYKYYLNMPK